jgi:hypothetical protein
MATELEFSTSTISCESNSQDNELSTIDVEKIITEANIIRNLEYQATNNYNNTNANTNTNTNTNADTNGTSANVSVSINRSTIVIPTGRTTELVNKLATKLNILDENIYIDNKLIYIDSDDIIVDAKKKKYKFSLNGVKTEIISTNSVIDVELNDLTINMLDKNIRKIGRYKYFFGNKIIVDENYKSFFPVIEIIRSGVYFTNNYTKVSDLYKKYGIDSYHTNTETKNNLLFNNLTKSSHMHDRAIVRYHQYDNKQKTNARFKMGNLYKWDVSESAHDLLYIMIDLLTDCTNKIITIIEEIIFEFEFSTIIISNDTIIDCTKIIDSNYRFCMQQPNSKNRIINIRRCILCINNTLFASLKSGLQKSVSIKMNSDIIEKNFLLNAYITTKKNISYSQSQSLLQSQSQSQSQSPTLIINKEIICSTDSEIKFYDYNFIHVVKIVIVGKPRISQIEVLLGDKYYDIIESHEINEDFEYYLPQGLTVNNAATIKILIDDICNFSILTFTSI